MAYYDYTGDQAVNSYCENTSYLASAHLHEKLNELEVKTQALANTRLAPPKTNFLANGIDKLYNTSFGKLVEQGGDWLPKGMAAAQMLSSAQVLFAPSSINEKQKAIASLMSSGANLYASSSYCSASTRPFIELGSLAFEEASSSIERRITNKPKELLDQMKDMYATFYPIFRSQTAALTHDWSRNRIAESNEREYLETSKEKEEVEDLVEEVKKEQGANTDSIKFRLEKAKKDYNVSKDIFDSRR